RYGYKMIAATDIRLEDDPFFTVEWLRGGLFAVQSIDASTPDRVVAAWNSLLEDWLPRSRYERGREPYLEEFLVQNGKVSRMRLFLPVVRKVGLSPIQI